jgi:hypothetical protein
MIKAAATGAVDYSHADPQDKYWWRRLRWITDAMAAEDDYRLIEAQHRHWVTIFANGQLDANSFDNAKANAQHYLTQLIGFRYPEYAKKLEQEAFRGSREGALQAFREEFGYPGDPRYEKMLEETMEAFKKLAEEPDTDWADDNSLWRD